MIAYDRDRDQPKYEPTLEEIAAAASEIRAKWNKTTERTRRGETYRKHVEVTESIMPQGVTEREVMW